MWIARGLARMWDQGEFALMNTVQFERRGFLQAAGGLAAGMMLGAGGHIQAAERKRVLRVAHLTDVHVQPELRAPEGMAACLRHLQDTADKPNLILSGGDHVMDCVRQPRERTKTQWDIWQRVSRAENSIPIRS